MYAPMVRVCRPFSNQLSSISSLLASQVLRVAVWILCVITLAGNLRVLCWRTLKDKKSAVLGTLIKNLAVCDLLMGIYLLVIIFQDMITNGRFNTHALLWTQSWQCSFSGFLAMFSSELSLLLVLLITLDRYRCIMRPYQATGSAVGFFVLTTVWLIASMIAAVPLFYFSFFNDRLSAPVLTQPTSGAPSLSMSNKFLNELGLAEYLKSDRPPSYYGLNSLCFPLHLNEPFMLGWQYSAIVLVVFNAIALLTITSLYTHMFVRIRADRRHVRPPLLVQSQEDARLALRFLLIVFTNCVCWLPIIGAKTLALSGHTVPASVHAWLVVFILPINSALNPIIYTVSGFQAPIKRLLLRRSQSTSNAANAYQNTWPQLQQQALILFQQLCCSSTVPGASTGCAAPSTNRPSTTDDQSLLPSMSTRAGSESSAESQKTVSLTIAVGNARHHCSQSNGTDIDIAKQDVAAIAKATAANDSNGSVVERLVSDTLTVLTQFDYLPSITTKSSDCECDCQLCFVNNGRTTRHTVE